MAMRGMLPRIRQRNVTGKNTPTGYLVTMVGL